MAETIVIKLEVDAKNGVATVGNLGGEVSDVNKELDDTSGVITGLTDQLDKMTGGAITGFKKFVTGAKSGIGAMKGLRVAVAATGIGLLLIAVTSLAAFFTKTEKGAQALRVIFAGLGAVVDELTDIFVSIGEAIFDAFSNPQAAVEKLIKTIGKFLDDPIQAFKDLKDAAVDFGEALVNDTKAAIALEESLNKLKVAERELGIARSESRSKIEELKSIGQDVANSAEVRVDALQKAAELEGKLLEKELVIAKEKLRITKEANELSSSDEDAKQAEADAQIRVNELISQSVTRQREVNNQLSALRKQEADKVNAELEVLNDAQLTSTEREIKAVEDKYIELFRLAKKYNQDIAVLEENRLIELQRLQGEEVATRTIAAGQIERNIAGTLKTNTKVFQVQEKAKTSISKEEQTARLNVVRGALGAVSALVGQENAAGKAIAVAATTIDTIRGAVSAFAQTPGGIVIKSLAAATATAFGLKSIKQILSTKIPGAASSGGGGAAPQAPRVGNAIGLINPNQQGEITGQSLAQGLNEQPMRAFVVSENVTNQQDLDNQIQANGEFG